MARWNTATWNYDRWPALAIADLLQQPPSPEYGHPIGAGDWKLVVEILLPQNALGLWGMAEWNEQEWNTLAWYDLTQYTRGMEWTRGADEPDGRPRVGECEITLNSPNGMFDPWSVDNEYPSWYAPGTIMRIGVRSASDVRANGWIPQFTGITNSWSQLSAGQNADRYVTIQLDETLRDLAGVDEMSLVSPVGSGDTVYERIERLLDAAEWPYGLEIDDEFSATTMQSTYMAQNRLAECYLTADSDNHVFRSSRKGTAFIYRAGDAQTNPDYWPLVDFSYYVDDPDYAGLRFDYFAETSGTTMRVPYDADSWVTSNTDTSIYNIIIMSRVGGTQQEWRQPSSIARYGPRTYSRSDLICTSDATVLDLCKTVSRNVAMTALRVTNIDISTSDRGDDIYLATIAADIGSLSYVYAPPPDSEGVRASIYGEIETMTHRVTPRSGGGATWTTNLGFDSRVILNIPGATLPLAPGS